MKIAVFFDLPDGGARYALYKILESLSKTNSIDAYTYKRSNTFTKIGKVCTKVFTYETPQFEKINHHLSRVMSDLYTIFAIPFVEKRIAKVINAKSYDLVIVNHTRHFQAPNILKYLSGKVMFLCHEPTRAFFEKELQPDKLLSWHNRMYEKTVRFVKKHIEISNAKSAKIVFANSSFSQKQVDRAYDITAHKLTMGVDTKEFFPMKCKKLNEILVIGNDEPQKNLKLAIDTMTMFPKHNRQVLHIVTPRDGTLAEISYYAYKKNIQLKVSSQVDQPTLRKIYNEAICTLAVARREPFGLSVIESMACGTPVVSIDEGGYRETVIHGVTGYLARRNSSDLAYFIRRVSKIDSQSCIDHVKDNFSWKNAAKEILQLTI